MQLAIISLRASLYSTRRLIEAADQQGASVTHFNPLDTRLTLHHQAERSQPAANTGVVIPRIAASVNYLGCTLLRQLQASGFIPLNQPTAIEAANDQLRTLQILQAQHLPFPRSTFGCQPAHLQALLDSAGSLPVVVKQVSGTHGEGVALVTSAQQAEQVIGQALARRENLLVQHYIEEANGQDIRCLVIGERVFAAIERRAQPGEFRANLHLGGRAYPIELTAEEQQLAVAASQAVGLQVAGVDLIRSAQGPLILEVNASPGLEGIEQTTGLDVAAEIVRFALSLQPQSC